MLCDSLHWCDVEYKRKTYIKCVFVLHFVLLIPMPDADTNKIHLIAIYLHWNIHHVEYNIKMTSAIRMQVKLFNKMCFWCRFSISKWILNWMRSFSHFWEIVVLNIFHIFIFHTELICTKVRWEGKSEIEVYERILTAFLFSRERESCCKFITEIQC